jgi:putative glutamine amidotransferase
MLYPAMQAYCQAVRLAGGEPRILPANLHNQTPESILAGMDGLLFSGGGDVSPAIYGGDNRLPHDDVIPERDDLELKLFTYVMQRSIPFIGICRGIQLINVALGGTLYVDLPSQLGDAIPHSTPDTLPADHPAHTVRLSSMPWLNDRSSEKECSVNSRHHQGIHIPGRNLQILASAPDGLIEAVQITGHPFGYAVQWHPENLLQDPISSGLFVALIEACKDGRYNNL